MMLRRWQLHAKPEPSVDLSTFSLAARDVIHDRQVISPALARAFNAKPERFFTRWGAERAGRFYTHRLGLPVLFEPEFLHEPVTPEC